ncbi:MAG: hypothetical protein RIQ89_2043 [Bacteroidota bacterium]|jgi:gas vesicle protein
MSDNSKFLSGLLLGALAGAALTSFLNSDKGKALIDSFKADESLQTMLDKAKKLVSDLEEKLKETPTT